MQHRQLPLTVSENNRHFLRDGKPFFWLADTVWSAFTSAAPEEWKEYLEFRRMQGYNVLQLNVLPQWDRSMPDAGIAPFHPDCSGRPDFLQYNDAYFERAAAMTETAVGYGFVPALVVLWCDYVQDSWATLKSPGHIMPLSAVQPYAEHVVRHFAPYNPVYVISGDSKFETANTVEYYRMALDTIKKLSPDALASMHPGSGPIDLPDRFVHSPQLDFYMYQPGHRLEEQHYPYVLADKLSRQPVKRPIVNAEPCYEGHGHGNKYGRFGPFDIRKAVWQGLLSGGHAGATYGAHGVWSWHRGGGDFPSEAFSMAPYDWRTALHLPGAWEAPFAKWIFETYDLFDCEPADWVLHPSAEVRAASTPCAKTIAVYIPYAAEVGLNRELPDYRWTLIALSNKRVAVPKVDIRNGRTWIRMHSFNEDVLVLAKKI